MPNEADLPIPSFPEHGIEKRKSMENAYNVFRLLDPFREPAQKLFEKEWGTKLHTPELLDLVALGMRIAAEEAGDSDAKRVASRILKRIQKEPK